LPAPSWILIDGYNLLHASGVFGAGGRTSLETSRNALLDWLGSVLSESQRQRATIVFDAREAPPGLPRFGQKHGIRIVFAPRGCEADVVLEDLIQEHNSPRSLLVVSSDHRVQRAARRRKATPIDSELWVGQVRRGARDEEPATDPRHDPRLDPHGDDLQNWLEEFRDD
jgi:predicted RNA-binding protein with PIN domain